MYHGERPKWWVYKAEQENKPQPHTWTGYCMVCEAKRNAEQAAFERRISRRPIEVPEGNLDLTPTRDDEELPPGLFQAEEKHDDR